MFLYIDVPWIYARWLRCLLKLRTAKLKSLVLTFDDGPGNKLTPIILHTLNEHKAKATFFLLGRNIPGREKIVRQIAEQGHEIGSHGYDHLHYWKVSPFRALLDIRRGWKAIDAALGVKQRKYPFRPPYGKLNLICLLYLWFKKVPVCYWTFDLGDTWSPHKRDGQRGANLTKHSHQAVVLAHDFDREDENDNVIVIDSLRAMLSAVEQKGIKIATIAELMNSKN